MNPQTETSRVRAWLMEGDSPEHAPTHVEAKHQGPWWKVMCLTGVDYFSTLGYQPGIAFLAAGLLAPIATLILVMLTLLGALPVYHQVAKASPNGQGSLAMLEELLPKWKGKAMVLCLLGFAATDFIITITLSAADASAHIRMNEILRNFIPFGQVPLTMLLVLLLGGIFIIGFREAIGLSFILVTIYLLLNLVVLVVAGQELINNPHYFADWIKTLYSEHKSILNMVGISALMFPKLALGLSGFETGVAVMPLVKGLPDRDKAKDGSNAAELAGRIKNTRLLLSTAAILMSGFLIASAMTTSLLIPAAEFAPSGPANGRALSHLCHNYLGHGWGTAYDLSTIAILWFAGASAMAGLLNLVPRYLPRYGMAPEWARANRPLVIFLTAVSLVVTVVFHADVDAQGGAYATGVLVLITSAAVAVTLKAFASEKNRRFFFALVTLVFAYTTIANVIERPDGLHIAAFFIATILITSGISRALRSTELRIREVVFDKTAKEFVAQSKGSKVRLVAHRPGSVNYELKERESIEVHNIEAEEIIFLEVTLGDASEFSEEKLHVLGKTVGKYKVLRCVSPAIPNAIAAILLHLRDDFGKDSHVYLGWTEGNPVHYVLKFIFLGEGETAPVTREILREAEPVPEKRPRVHVG